MKTGTQKGGGFPVSTVVHFLFRGFPEHGTEPSDQRERALRGSAHNKFILLTNRRSANCPLGKDPPNLLLCSYKSLEQILAEGKRGVGGGLLQEMCSTGKTRAVPSPQ
jgi:hypothetical protein